MCYLGQSLDYSLYMLTTFSVSKTTVHFVCPNNFTHWFWVKKYLKTISRASSICRLHHSCSVHNSDTGLTAAVRLVHPTNSYVCALYRILCVKLEYAAQQGKKKRGKWLHWLLKSKHTKPMMNGDNEETSWHFFALRAQAKQRRSICKFGNFWLRVTGVCMRHLKIIVRTLGNSPA